MKSKTNGLNQRFLKPSRVSPIVNGPAGMSAMPTGMAGALVLYKRKNLASEVLVRVTVTLLLIVIGTTLLTVTQFGAARLVVPCNM